MATLDEIRKQYPFLADASDDQVVDSLHQAFYADLPRQQVADQLGVKAAEEKPKPAGAMRRAADAGVSLLKGAIGVPEAVVGMADLATGGRAGKALENEDGAVGFRPKQAKAFLDTMLSPQQQAANREVQEASQGEGGFLDKVGRVGSAAVRNPSVIVHSALESLPSMGAGGVVGRGAMAVAPRIGAVGAGAAGEGVVTMGSQAEQIRQETPDGLLTGEQAALAAGSGAATGLLGLLGGRIARRMGIADVDTLLVGQAGPAATKGFTRRVLEGAVSEGLLEELPQSVQEQVAQNAALGKPLDEGVPQAAVLGALTGAAMGGGGQLFTGKSHGDVIREADLQPETGPMTRAANVGTEAIAREADADVAAAAADPAPVTARAANADTMALIRTLDEDRQQDALHLLNLAARTDVAIGVQRYAQKRLDALLAPVEQGQAAEAAGQQQADQQKAQAQAEKESAAAAEKEADALQAITRKNAPDSAFTGERGLTKAFTDPGYDGAPVQLAAQGFKPTEIQALQRSGLADEAGGMAPSQFQAWSEESAARAKAAEAAATAAAKPKPAAAPVPAPAPAPKPASKAPAKPEAKQPRAPAPPAQPKEESFPPPAAGDVLNPRGEPFVTMRAALGALRGRETTHEIKRVAGGLALRPKPEADRAPAPSPRVDEAVGAKPAAPAPVETPAPAAVPAAAAAAGAAPAAALAADAGATPVAAPRPKIVGEPIDAEWTAFAAASGTKSIPRADMPQIRAEHRGAMTQFLLARGIAHEQDAEVDPATLKPTQAEFSPGKVAKAREFTGGDRSILVSSDGHVLDGHHQWVAKLEAGEPVKVIRLDAPIDKLLAEVKEFPSATAAEGAASAAPVAPPVSAPVPPKPASVAAPAPAVSPAAPAAPTKPKKRLPAAQRAAEAREQNLRDYFAPGNVVPTYGGRHDEILSLTIGEDGGFSVKVHEVKLVDGQWVRVGQPHDTRRHSTFPDARDLKAGPVARLQHQPAAEVAYTDGKKPDGTARPEAVDRGTPPAPPAEAATAPADAAPAVSANTVFTEDAAAAARALLKRKLGQVTSGVDPEVLQAGITLAGYHVERGARTFAAYARAMLADLGEGVRPYLKSWYMGVRYDPRAAGFDGMDTAAAVDALDVDQLGTEKDNAPQEATDVPDPDTNLERDRGLAGDGDVAVAGTVPREGPADGAGAARGRAGSSRRGRPDDPRLPDGGAAAARELGDQPVHRGDRPARPAEFDAGAGVDGRGDSPGFEGVQADAFAGEAVAEATVGARSDAAKRQRQRDADRVAVEPGDLANVRETLPYLLEGQQEDVHKTEIRFAKPNGYGMLFTNGTGTGKAQPLDAKLMTPGGWKLMGDIRPGDQVIGVDGKTTRVVSVHPQGDKLIYRVTFSDGAATECCDEHLWETQTIYQRRKARANPDWKCAQPLVRSLADIRATLEAQHFVPVAAPLELDTADLALPPYIMGALLGDGCITQNTITFASADPEIAERVSRDLPGSMELRLIADGKRCPQYRISLVDQVRRPNGQMEQHPWLRALREMGLHGADSAAKFVPGTYLRGSIAQRVELLQGLMDTDGWVDRKSRSPYFCSVSKALADAVAFLARSLGGTATIHPKRTSYAHLGERREGQLAYNVCLNLPAGIAPFALVRKASLYRANTKYPPRRRIVGVELVGTKKAQCIAVDHPRHLYVTDDCIVTHNTFTGLGVVKRFARQGKSDTLIVVPDVKIMSDWVESGKALGLTITPLKDTKDAGRGITITTYANLGENDELVGRRWDLVLPDEAHLLMQAADAKDTLALNALRALTMHPRGALTRYEMLNRDDIERLKAISEKIKANDEIHDKDDTTDAIRDSLAAENEVLEEQHAALSTKLAAARAAVEQGVADAQGAARTRVVALSATPFAYEKTVDWAEGYLFDYPPASTSGAYNTPSPDQQFMIEHFGYRMKSGKLNQPDSKVDRGLMQRQFNGWLKREGVLSGRMLDVEADYDRKFVLVDSAVGNMIDRAMDWVDEQRAAEAEAQKEAAKTEGEQPPSGFAIVNSILRERLYGPQGHLVRRYLLEAIKAKEVVQHVRDHLALGRKLVVFHDFKKGGATNPFDFPRRKLPPRDQLEDVGPTEYARMAADMAAYNEAAAKFRAEFAELSGDRLLNDLVSPIERFTREFPDVLLINGDQKKSDLLARYKKFNDDTTGPLVALVQSAKNKGWSGHDTTGVHPRVLFNLGLPTQPTLTIQQEGRIYRTGQVSDAMFRYLNTGTNWERWAFAQTIAERASAAENLASGEQARALRDAFISGFEESDDFRAGHEGEGKGGKERDRLANQALTEFDRAKAFYWGTAKKTANTKAQEGVDYFATPEPIGLKMVQMLDLRGGEDALEPSAGHGAIARWFGETINRTAVEPSNQLGSRLAMVFDGKIIRGKFEDLNVVNKFDGIAMNPPFGSAGRTAIDHLAKAATHLRDGGRIAALIPTGPAADAKFEKWFYEEEQRPAKPLATHPTLGPIYLGDTVTTRASWMPKGVVTTPSTAATGGGYELMARAAGTRNSSGVTLASVTAVEPTGKRTVAFRPAEGLHLVADIQLPSVTFERAGTAVRTRIVVIEKAEKAPQQVNIDLSRVEDIGELFNRVEAIELKPRAKPIEEAPAATAAPAKAGKAAEPAPAAPVDPNAVVEHVTQKGKTIKGVVRTDLTPAQAQQVDPYSWKKNGGQFIRLQHLAKLNELFPLPAAATAPAASRADATPAPLPTFKPRAAQVRDLVREITASWSNAPTVVVAIDAHDPVLPDAWHRLDGGQKSQGATGEMDGAYIGGKVYLNAELLPDDRDVVRVLMHESVGHHGLRGQFGTELGTILDRLAVLNAGKVRDKARSYGLDYDKPSHRRMAAEEVLAEMAQTRPELGWVAKAIAAIRTWAREHIPGFGKMQFSDDEIIKSFLLPARAWVQSRAAPATDTVVDATPADAMASRGGLADTLANAMNNARDVKLPAGYLLGDMLNRDGKLDAWSKTVGTPYNLAQRDAGFKRVFDRVQTFLNDVSAYATAAADLAPRILPKLETWRDLRKMPVTAADSTAIAAPIFEGTLSWGRDEQGKVVPMADLEAKAEGLSADDKAQEMLRRGAITEPVLKMWRGLPVEQFEANVESRYASQVLKAGVVWTNAELADRFKLTDGQVSLYREFRAAVDRSLTDLTVSEMVRYGGKDITPAVREAALQADGVDAAAELLRNHLFALAEAEADRADVLNDTANGMIDRADRAKDLMARGYAPLSRFGTYTLDVLDAAGERVYFGLFESTAERAKMARAMRANFPGATISTGTTSQKEFEQFAGVSPETIEIFGDMLGLDPSSSDASGQAFQTYLRKAKSNRSALKRLIHRKGIAGFSEDAGRVLAGFVYSNARRTSTNLHDREIGDAINEMPQGAGETKDAALDLVGYVRNPQEEAQALRSALFAQYLGGSIASAMVNATQPVMVTLPWLSQYGGAAKAAKAVAGAAKTAATGGSTGDAALDAALKKAEADGIVAPQEVHQLMAQAMGRATLRSGDGTTAGDALATARNAVSKLALAWGKVFSLAEHFNRRLTFIAAYRTAVDQGMEDPAAFAAKAVAETQFVYNKGNRPKWARGAIGSVAFTFKTYSINYMEMVHRMATTGGPEGRKAALLAMAVLFLMAGADGLPFASDLDDVIDGIMQRLGYNFSSKQAKQQFFIDALGKEGADLVMKGVTGLPGVPIDVSGRLGLGNLIPATGLFLKKDSYGRDLAEIAGPVSDLAKRAADAMAKAGSGNLAGAAVAVSPVAVRNAVQGADMAETGMYRDTRGYKVIDTTLGEAAGKAIGFQPKDVARVQEATWEQQRSKALYQLRGTEIRAAWAKALFEGDTEGVADARQALADWNRKNPDQPMTANMPAILKRVREMRKSKEERIGDTAPKAIRENVRRQLAEELR